MPADPRIAPLQDMLATEKTMMQQLTIQRTSQAGNVSKNADLQDQLTSLRAQLATVRKSAETYDREFLDRKQAGEGVPTRWRRWGFSTLQDWVLAAFFSSYAFVSIVLILAAAAHAGENWKMAAGFMTMASVVVGILVSTVLLRIG